MLRKVFRTGNSIVVSLPREMLDTLGIGEGQQISVELDRVNRQILIRPAQTPIVASIDDGFARQVNEFIERYRPALEALARK